MSTSPIARVSAAGHGAGAGHRDLLTDDRSYERFVRVDRPWRADTWRRRDEWAEQRVGAEEVVDRDGVGVEVEQPTHAADGRREVAPVGQPERGLHVIIARPGDDSAVAVRQIERPLIRLAVPQFDTGDRPRAEELEQLAAGEWAADREPDGYGTRIRSKPAGATPPAQLARRGRRRPRARCR